MRRKRWLGYAWGYKQHSWYARNEAIAIDETYGFVYCGANGLGFGVFTVTDGRLEGRDMGNLEYIGTATEAADGWIEIDLKLKVPAGAPLVQGTSPQALPHERHTKHRFPSGFGDGKPHELDAPPGTVTAMIKRIPDEFARAARDGFSIQIARQLSAAGTPT